jgi:hypothetical protein
MNFKEAIDQLNIVAQCKKYNLPLYQCPQFLFLVMGAVIGATAIISYALGTKYVVDPNIVALIVLLMTIFLFSISFVIIKSLEKTVEANRLKTEFIGIISHQLRSPISNLKWSINLLASGRLGKMEAKQEEYLKIINDNTERMRELVSSLLMVSKIEQGRLPLQKAEFSLAELVKEIINKFKAYAQSSGIEIIFKTDDLLPNVIADQSQIKSAVENLLDNAIRYTDNSGKIEINIQKRGSCLLFSIIDGGVGIPQRDQKHIFQKFFRAGNAAKYQTQGSGLGLYIVKSIIEKSKGKIWFKSIEGEGTTFSFTLPFKK